MPIVTVEPSGVTFEVGEDESVMSGALRSGLRWPTVCGGQGTCGVCAFRTDDTDALSPMEPAEQSVLRTVRIVAAGGAATVRLACQTRPTADITVYRRGVRPQR